MCVCVYVGLWSRILKLICCNIFVPFLSCEGTCVSFLLYHKLLTQSEEHVEHFHILKAQSTLKAIARDWSSEGAEERDQSYKPIIDAIEQYYDPKE